MSNEKLQDFGEHIAGAKKETHFKAIDLSNEETKKLPLSKLWSDKDIKDIEDNHIRAVAFALKDSLPNKPRNYYKLSHWLDTLHRHQNTVVDLLQKNDLSYTNAQVDKIANISAKSKAYLLPNVEFDDYKRIGKIAFYKSAGSNGVRLSVRIDDKEHSFSPKEPASLVDFDYKKILDEFSNDIKTILQERQLNTNQPKQMTASSFDIYTRRRDDTAFICAKTDRQKTPLIEFETLAEAREYKKDPENIAELSRRWTAHREHNSITKTDMRNAVNEERTGQSYRDQDITPDEFMTTFGVRGGQFGNWVTGDERQAMLNATYDGFMDLSKALNIEPKAIGLNGTLGIAFGARGSGSASAHYETDEKVINLTKTRGAGSLAHEWWHALDHSMSSTVELTTKNFKTWASPQGNKLREDIRTEPMNDSLKLLMNTIKNSDLQKRSQTADAYRSPAYFSTNVEMTARAFESYIQHELSKNGIKNDFLVNIKAEKDWQKNLDAYPYPKAEELEPLGKAYNTVFDTLKEVDKEFVPVHYEPEQIIHADTLAVTGAEKTKENQSFALDTYLQNNGFTQDIHGIWQKEVSGYDEKLIIFGYPNSSLDIRLGDNRSTLIAKMDENISLEEVHKTFTESWYSDLVEWRLGNEKTQEHAKQSLNTVEPQAQTVGETTPTQEPQVQSVQSTIQAEQPTQPTPVAEQQQATTPMPNISQYNTKLNTPYAEKNQAKALGAKWDNDNKTWYVPAGLDLSKFEKWLVPEKEKTTENPAPATTPQSKTYLYTTPSDNEAIQKLKADGIVKFDLPNKVWYTLEPENPQVKQWLHPAHVPSAEEAFAEHLRANGISLDNGHPIADGRPHRLSNDGSNDKNVMYQLYRNDGGIPAGRITNFSRGGTPEKWVYPAEYIAVLKNIEAVNIAKGLAKPTPSITHSNTEKTYYTQEQGQTPKTHSISPEQQATYDKTASRVAMVMQFAPLAQQHEYLDRKQVTHNNIMRIVPDKSHLPPQFANDIVIANGWKEAQALRNQGDERMILQKGNLMIPQFNAQGELRSFETIGYQGAKYALKVGEKNGLSVALGQVKNGEPVIITEGYATGATLHEQTNRAVLVAFGKGGLLAVAQQIREHCPDSKIYIGADNDHAKTLEINPNTGKPHENVGLVDAHKVAETVPNTHVLAPQFNAGDKGKDWNDVYVNQGVDEFKRQLKEQLNRINPPKEQPNLTQSEPTVQERLDIDFIKQSYPQISDENLKAIQVWKEVITHSEKYAPETKEDLLKRLADHIPSYANGEQLPLPAGYTEQQHDMGKQTAIDSQHQEKDDGGR